MELWTAATPNGWKVSIMIEELIEAGSELGEVSVRNIDLAKSIGIDPSSLSAYCSDREFSPPRRCPDWIIMTLIKLLEVKICISKDSIEIIEG